MDSQPVLVPEGYLILRRDAGTRGASRIHHCVNEATMGAMCGVKGCVWSWQRGAEVTCKPCLVRIRKDKPMRTRTQRSWDRMKQRCNDPSHVAYHNYGGRGIRVCDRWNDSFDAFLQDMGERPEGKTLDRYPDKDGDYEPGNCRWATWKEQQRNRRDRKELTAFGKSQIVPEWAEEYGVRVDLIQNRLRRGWSLERALTEPKR